MKAVHMLQTGAIVPVGFVVRPVVLAAGETRG